MKNVILMSLLTLAPIAASASPISCQETAPLFDYGIQLDVAADGNSAVLSTQSKRGLVKRADLRCEHLVTPQSGQGYTFLRCEDVSANDYGYVAELRSSAFVGLITADLSERTKERTDVIARLSCRIQR